MSGKFLIFSLVIFHTAVLFGQSKTLDTPLEPVVISGADAPDFTGVATGELFLYAYSQNSWQVIPFQIDERDTLNRFTEPDFITGLDANDEIVFMAKDAGDKADGTWIVIPESQPYPRYEFEVSATDGGKAWVYLYRIPTNQPAFSPIDYVDHIDAPEGTVSDTVEAEGVYKVGAAANGFPGSLKIFDGGSGVDILERQLIEIKADLGFPVTLNDSLNFAPNSVVAKDGAVRVIRELVAGIVLVPNTDPVIGGLVFPILYYNTLYEVRANLLITTDLFAGLPFEVKIVGIKQAFRLTDSAVGLSFFNAANSGGIAVDGSPEIPDASLVTSSEGVNRFLFKGSQATFITKYLIPDIGQSQSLFYEDDSNAETPAYGNAGFEITGENILGEAPLGLGVVFPGVVADGDEGKYISTEFRELSVESNSQNYGEVTSVDLAQHSVAPEEFNLAQNYPNPFNPSTLIQYSIPNQSHIDIKVYNLLGTEIVTLVNRRHSQGNYSIVWNGKDRSGNEVAAGVYIYRLKAGNIVQTRKMLLIK